MTNKLDLPSVIVTLVLVIIAIYGFVVLWVNNADFGVSNLPIRLLYIFELGITLMFSLGCIVKIFGLTQGDLEAMAPKQ